MEWPPPPWAPPFANAAAGVKVTTAAAATIAAAFATTLAFNADSTAGERTAGAHAAVDLKPGTTTKAEAPEMSESVRVTGVIAGIGAIDLLFRWRAEREPRRRREIVLGEFVNGRTGQAGGGWLTHDNTRDWRELDRSRHSMKRGK